MLNGIIHAFMDERVKDTHANSKANYSPAIYHLA